MTVTRAPPGSPITHTNARLKRRRYELQQEAGPTLISKDPEETAPDGSLLCDRAVKKCGSEYMMKLTGLQAEFSSQDPVLSFLSMNTKLLNN